MATLDSIEGIVSSNNFMIGQINGFPTGSPAAMRTILANTQSAVNDVASGALGIGTINAKLDALSVLLQHVSDGIDTLLNTLNGGHIDQQTDLIIEKLDDVLVATNLIGTENDDYNAGQHTLFGGLNSLGGIT